MSLSSGIRPRVSSGLIRMAQHAARILRIHVPEEGADTPGSNAWLVWAPLVALFVCLSMFRLSYADVALSECCYCQLTDRWPMGDAEPWQSLYYYGCIPAFALGIGGLLTALVCLIAGKWKPVRRAGFFLALALLLGPGLLVNLTLKPMMGRPRPAQTQAFGGDESFFLVGTPAQLENCRSFPSGHASMGFFLMAPAFMLTKRHRRLAGLFVVLGGTFGLAMGAARILQGAHFASDVLGAAICVYVGALAARMLLNRIGGPIDRPLRKPVAPALSEPAVWGERVAA